MADNNQVIEERVECMVPPNGGNACLRKAYFLKPSVTSINGSAVAPSATSSAARLGEFKDLRLKVNYFGWLTHPSDTWKAWVGQMHSLHNSTWKKSGILEAVMSSTCHIHRCNEMILGLVEKWSPTTNSFVFPWGEATVTLEDMAVLGGYSVLGESVLFPIGDAEGEEVMKKLVKSRSGIIKSKSKNASQGKWMSQFMGSGSEIEHEAFLAYWLSRFVFPFWRNTIGRSVLPIAVHLARGTRIALAPAALAPIYKSFSHLKASIIGAQRSGGKDVVEVTVSAQLGLVQVWIWERFPSLRPNPRSIGENEARLMRWHDLKLKSDYRLLAFDSAGEDFVWQPYRNREKENGFRCEGLVRWLRATELVSLEENCIEQYLPHRVAMQFGLDQDIPGHVARLDINPEIAFRDYSRPIADVKLHIPSPVPEGCVTSRYSKWWKKLNHDWIKDSKNSFATKLEDDYLCPPPGFRPKRKRESLADNNGGEGSSKETDCNESVAEHCADNNGVEGNCKSLKKDGEAIESSDYSESVAEHTQVNPPPPSSSSSHSSSRIEKHVCIGENDDHLSGNVGEEMVIADEPKRAETEEKMRVVEKLCDLIKFGTETEEKMRVIEKLCDSIKAGKLYVKMKERKAHILFRGEDGRIT